jgi:hypothetical protein
MLTSRSNSGLQVSGIFLDISHIGSNDITENQITPFSFSTPDNETLYAWHVMPLGLYAKHEAELLREPSGFAEDITRTKPFKVALPISISSPLTIGVSDIQLASQLKRA